LPFMADGIINPVIKRGRIQKRIRMFESGLSLIFPMN